MMKRFFGKRKAPGRLRKALMEGDLRSVEQVVEEAREHNYVPWGEPDLLNKEFLLLPEKPESLGVFKALLRAGWKPDLEARDPMGRTALHLCVDSGNAGLMKALLEAGADPNARDRDGVTPLNLCKSYSGTEELSALLLQAGGDPLLTDKTGKNYLM